MHAEPPFASRAKEDAHPFRTERIIVSAWLLVIAAYVVAVSAVARPLAALLTLFSWALAACIAAWSCWRAARNAPPAERTPWALFAAASATLALQLLWVWIDVTTRRPITSPSGPDLALIAFGVLTSLAIFSFRNKDPSHFSAARRAVNIALISCAFAAACTAAFLEPALQHPRGAASLIVALTQLLVFAFAFVTAVYVLWSFRWSSLRGSPLQVVLAVAVQATCSLFYVHAAYVRRGGPPVYIGAAWMISFALLHWASRTPVAVPALGRLDPSVERQRERLVDALMPGALLVLLFGSLFAFRADVSERTLMLVGVFALVFAFVLAARELLVHFEEVRMERELRQRRAELERTQESLRDKTSALQGTEQWLRVASEAGKVGLWAWDLATDRVYYSAQWKAQLGYGPDELSDAFEEWRSRVHPDDLPRAMNKIETYLANPAGDYEVEFRLRHRDGGYRWILARAALLRDAQGAPASLVGSHIDVTQQKELELSLYASTQRERERAGELEERVLERTRELQEANRELESFAYAVAHDLKAPLRAMSSFSSLLLESSHLQQRPAERGYAERIRAGALRMNALIEGLLAYARMDRRALSPELVSIKESVESALAPFDAEIAKRSVHVSITVPDSPLRADREALAMILRNLIENAFKFTRNCSAPRIEVSASAEANRLVLRVKDNGVGFDMEYHDRLFVMFERLHRDAQFPGAGVGLALAAKAAQRLRGKLWAQSAPGEGACFFLELPL